MYEKKYVRLYMRLAPHAFGTTFFLNKCVNKLLEFFFPEYDFEKNAAVTIVVTVAV